MPIFKQKETVAPPGPSEAATDPCPTFNAWLCGLRTASAAQTRETLERHPEWATKQEGNATAMDCALFNERADLVAILAEKMSEATPPRSADEGKTKKGKVAVSWLVDAAKTRSAECVKALLPWCDPNESAEEYPFYTPLMAAVDANRLEVAEALLPASNPKLLDGLGRSAFQLCLRHNSVDMARLLLPTADLWFGARGGEGLKDESGEPLRHAQAARRSGENALDCAIGWGNVRVAQELLPIMKERLTPEEEAKAWIRAAQAGPRSMLELLAPCVDVNARRSADGASALIVALGHGDGDMLDFLIPLADLRIQAADGATALGEAARGGHAEDFESIWSRIAESERQEAILDALDGFFEVGAPESPEGEALLARLVDRLETHNAQQAIDRGARRVHGLIAALGPSSGRLCAKAEAHALAQSLREAQRESSEPGAAAAGGKDGARKAGSKAGRRL